MTRAVHQLLPVLSPGDAISSAALEMRMMLRRIGFRSEIYAQLIDQELSRQARPAAGMEREVQPDDAVIYHLSTGFPVARLFEVTRARRVIAYHNITPPRYYRATSPRVTYELERGRADLLRLTPLADLCLAGSTYSLAELVAAGARRYEVIPPAIDLERLSPRPSVPPRPPVILFVGRVAPHKRHDDLIRTLAALRATAQPAARLVLAGGTDDTGAYARALWALARRLRVSDAVELPGVRLTDTALASHYAGATVFACASDHEGFCVPLIEAMAFSVPVVAFAAGAVPETVGNAGILLRQKDPLVWAAIIDRLITDRPLRATLIDAGRRRLAGFSPGAIEGRLATALAAAGITPSRN